MIKDLTASRTDRQNILNNHFAIEMIQDNIGYRGVLFEGEYRYTKRQLAHFFDVSIATLERYLEKYEKELRENGYEVLTGKRLNEAKKHHVTLIGEGEKKAPSLGVFNFRGFLNLAMLLVESDRKNNTELSRLYLYPRLKTKFRSNYPGKNLLKLL
ncbi:hypothetical protein HGA91_00530 [candidate division WWE3 bacterium]|nr:hypothetical protein [candidate division WWE3 bacterium]